MTRANDAFHLRPARTSDLAEILDLNRKTITMNNLSKRRLSHYLRAPSCTVTVISDQTSIKAAMIVEYHARWKRAYIATIFTDDACKKRGLASSLLEKSLHEAAKRKMKRFDSHVAVNNTRSLDFHKKHGFEIVKRIENYDDDGLDAYLLRKKL